VKPEKEIPAVRVEKDFRDEAKGKLGRRQKELERIPKRRKSWSLFFSTRNATRLVLFAPLSVLTLFSCAWLQIEPPVVFTPL